MEKNLEEIVKEGDFVDQARTVAHDVGNMVQTMILRIGLLEIGEAAVGEADISTIKGHIDDAKSGLNAWHKLLKDYESEPSDFRRHMIHQTSKDFLAGLVKSFGLLSSVAEETSSYYAEQDGLSGIANTSCWALYTIEHLQDVAEARPPRSRCFDPHDVVTQAMSAGFRMPNVEVERRVCFDDGRFEMYANPVLLYRIVSNLEKNSVENFAENGLSNGLIEIDAGADYFELDSCSQPIRGEYVRLDFSDNGTGIPEEVSDRLFSRGTSTRGDGRGLGLYGVKSMAESMNGCVGWQSEPGKGTTIHIYLPGRGM